MGRKNEVTDVRVNIKRSNRRSIFINGEYAFSLSEGIFFESGIEVGNHLTAEKIRKLKSLDQHERIKESALTLLSYRPRSVQEMRNRLRDKGWTEGDIEPVIKELEKKDLLNDKEFAAVFSRDRVQRKFLGPAALRHELRQAGIDAEMAEEFIEKTYQETPPERLIQSLIEAKRIDISRPMDRKKKERLISLLRRKGFSWSDIEPVVSRLKTD